MKYPIDTVVVLVLENRSFDHMLGFMQSPSYPIDGLTGNESNPIDPYDPEKGSVTVSDDARYHGDLADPGHSLNPAVIRQLYGLSGQAIEGRKTFPRGTPKNNGFVFDYEGETSSKGQPRVVAANIMKCFAPSKLPALAGLAANYAICDRWFSSIPGPTLPNRWFIHCGTSAGYVGGSLKLTALNPIQFLLSINGCSWKVYYGDIPHALTLMRLWDWKSNFVQFDQFIHDAAAGQLPNYSFIEPRYFLGAEDEHPPHNVALGELLIARIYNALRSSPQWDRCLFVITYDEHGGTFDHVPPPRIVRPDDLVGYDNSGDRWLSFAFGRAGVRVPAVVVSPWIPPATIDSTSRDHASILATIEALFSLPPLSNRDRVAPTLLSLLKLDAPRADAPASIEAPAEAAETDAPDHSLSDFQRELLNLARQLPAPEPGPMTEAFTAAAVGDSERAAAAYVSAKVALWQRQPTTR